MLQYEGLRLWDKNDDYILNAETDRRSDNSIWTPQQIVPENQNIVGFRLYEGVLHIENISFLLGQNGHPGVVSEINFPSLEVYPSFDLFKSKHPESFPAVKYVTLGWNGLTQELSLLKLGFTDGSHTTFESAYFNRDRINQDSY